jgi:hypothetical protein
MFALLTLQALNLLYMAAKDIVWSHTSLRNNFFSQVVCTLMFCLVYITYCHLNHNNSETVGYKKTE